MPSVPPIAMLGFRSVPLCEWGAAAVTVDLRYKVAFAAPWTTGMGAKANVRFGTR